MVIRDLSYVSITFVFPSFFKTYYHTKDFTSICNLTFDIKYKVVKVQFLVILYKYICIYAVFNNVNSTFFVEGLTSSIYANLLFYILGKYLPLYTSVIPTKKLA
jgi:hypothetical protein